MSNTIMIRTLKAGAFTAALSLSTLTMTQAAQAAYCSWYQWGCSEPSDEDIKNSAKTLQIMAQQKRDETFKNAPKNSTTIGATRLRNGTIVYNASGWKRIYLPAAAQTDSEIMPQLDPIVTNLWAKKLNYISKDGDKGFKHANSTDHEKIGKEHWYNFSGPVLGTANASHTEAQAIYKYHNQFSKGKMNALAFAKKSPFTSCPSCRNFLRFYTKKFNQRIAVASSKYMYFFKNGICMKRLLTESHEEVCDKE